MVSIESLVEGFGSVVGSLNERFSSNIIGHILLRGATITLPLLSVLRARQKGKRVRDSIREFLVVTSS